ncbi:MAG TPA: SUF system NifU family Fe-S cluster assembly protein [Methylomirabilota bacterium]|nr:SUF system NifU family Fe-S cluster assembly protein [Methylomirabilota bacterium]
MFDELGDLYQQLILEHSKSPRNFHKLEIANRMAEGHNPLCGDRVTVYALVQDGLIKDISFQGSGCAISKASASMMTTILKGKSREEATRIFEAFRDLVTNGETQEDVGKLAAFGGVSKFPARVKCAILPWHAVVATLQEAKPNVVSTE